MNEPSRRVPTHSGRHSVRFILDGELVELAMLEPTTTVLELLREQLGRMGTKEGCAEGDCGACTVVLGELDGSGSGLTYRAVNACIQFAPTLDGKQLITVESLCRRDGQLHPVQRAMVEEHASQCGFCTPGFVMSLFALHRSDPRPSRRAIDEALAGNLCRCTGYRPIVAAAQAAEPAADSTAEPAADSTAEPAADSTAEPAADSTAEPAADSTAEPAVDSAYRFGQEADTIHALQQLRHDPPLAFGSVEGSYHAPTSIAALADLLVEEPEAQILAGGTDVGLWVTKQLRDLKTLVFIGQVRELQQVQVEEGYLEIGAAVSLARASSELLMHYPELSELFLRFASPPIRNAGTLCGNIANGSPIGDSMAALMVLGAELSLRRGPATRALPLSAFYLGYQKNALREGEFVRAVRIPLPSPVAHGGTRILRSYKVSKRFEQDISAVCAAFALEMDGGVVTGARLAYGGMAATVARAGYAERALLGAAWEEVSVRRAMAELERDYTPMGDMRASAGYRMLVAKNLLYRCLIETTGPEGTTPTTGEGIYWAGRLTHG